MSRLLNIELSHTEARSETFLLGLFVGLSLLLPVVVHFDHKYDSHLRTLTNIYGVLALAGAVLAFWRIWRRSEKPRTLLSLPSFWICIGLSIWVVAQVMWIVAKWNDPNFRGSGLYDIGYTAADVCWLVALLMVFKSLDRRVVTAISPIMAIITTGLVLLMAGFAGLDHALIARLSELDPQLSSGDLLTLLTDLVYVLLTFCAIVLAVTLLLGINTELPLPVHQCLRYLFAATLIEAIATVAYLVTIKLNATQPFSYIDGNLVDSLFLTAMFFWGISALKCPIRRDELDYTFGTLGSGVSVEDIYGADEIARHYSVSVPDRDFKIDSQSRQWILDNIPDCWGVAKLGDLVVGSALIFPVPRSFMESFDPKTMKECEIFEKVKRESVITWDCLYLADASTLMRHRGRGIALKCFSETIETIAKRHPRLNIQVYCWRNIPQKGKLVEKLQAYLKEHKEDLKNRVSINSV